MYVFSYLQTITSAIQEIYNIKMACLFSNEVKLAPKKG